MRWSVLGVPIDSMGAPAGGPPYGTEEAPAALRRRGLVARLDAHDLGDLDVRVTGPERDPESGLVGWPSLGTTTARIRSAVAGALDEGRRPLLLGGCCALVMGAVAGARDARGRVGVVSVDGHVDVYDHHSSPTGEGADLPMAALRGRGWPGLLRELGPGSVVAAGDAVVLGARDDDERADVGDLPERLGVVVDDRWSVGTDPQAAAGRAVRRFAADAVPYWVHLDVDVLDEQVFPATDYLMPGGLDLAELAALLGPLGRDEGLLGFSVGCYNPSKDPTGHDGDALVELLVEALR
jgi:arginase